MSVLAWLKKENDLSPEAIKETLCQAFDSFSTVSEQLVHSNEALQEQLQKLKNQFTEVDRQRLQAIENKSQLSNRFDHVLELLPTGIVVLDEMGCVQQSNIAANDLFGFSLLKHSWMQVIQECFAPRLDDGHEVSLKDGRRISIQTRSLPDGLGQMIVLNDLTETRLLQERLERHRRLLELGKMTAALAHQIRTPLASAMLYASHLVSEKLSSEKKSEFSKRIMGSLQHLEKQVKDMLLFARSEIPASHAIELGVLFSELELALTPILEKTGSYLKIKIANPECTLLCNKEALLGAFMNLANNAIEAVGSSAQIFIRAGLNENKSLEICIEDRGPGISLTLKNTVFQAFFSTKENGTGLGLAVVESVAKAHHATVVLNDSVEGGAQFIWTFPAALLSESS